MVSPVRMDRVHPLRKMEPRFTYCRGFEVGLEWNWRESSSCNLLIDKRLSVDYTLLRSSISKKRRSSCDIRAPLLRCIVCSHDDAVLVAVVCSSRIGVAAVVRNCRARVAQVGAAKRARQFRTTAATPIRDEHTTATRTASS